MTRRPKPSRRPTKPTASLADGTHSVESLHHFRCGACQRWWSIGDAPKRRRWFCPWCGEENRFAVAPGPAKQTKKSAPV